MLVRNIAKDPEKWHPMTKETADYSLPYIVDRALLDGGIWLDAYNPSKLQAEDVLRLLKTTSVKVSPSYDLLYPSALPAKVTVELGDGAESAEVMYPKGHCKNPLTDQELESKYVRLGAPKEALKVLWNIENYEVHHAMSVLGRSD